MSDPIFPFLPAINNDAKVIDVKLTPEYQDLVRNVRAQICTLEFIVTGLASFKEHYAIDTTHYMTVQHFERRTEKTMQSLIDAIRNPKELEDLHKRFIDFAKFIFEEAKIGDEKVFLRAVDELERMGVHVE